MSASQSIKRAALGLWGTTFGRSVLGRQIVFRYLYRNNHWGNAESVSGPGSSLIETSRFRSELVQFCRDNAIKSIVDVPCGDLHWIREVDYVFEKYVGYDIVPEIISELRGHPPIPNAEFYVADMVKLRPPAVDLILSRDSFIHLCHKDVIGTLKNMAASGSTYLMSNTYPGVDNEEIPTGRWRPVDLQAAPFGLPTPLTIVNEESVLTPSKRMAIWSCEDLRSWASTRS